MNFCLVLPYAMQRCCKTDYALAKWSSLSACLSQRVSFQSIFFKKIDCRNHFRGYKFYFCGCRNHFRGCRFHFRGYRNHFCDCVLSFCGYGNYFRGIKNYFLGYRNHFPGYGNQFCCISLLFPMFFHPVFSLFIIFCNSKIKFYDTTGINRLF